MCNTVCAAHSTPQLNRLHGYRMAYRIRQGREFVTPPAGLSYTGQCVAPVIPFSQSWTVCCDRFLYQMDHLGQKGYKPSPVLEKALDVLFLLHADHELNASCTTVLQTGSSLVDPYSAIASVALLILSASWGG
jgi:citrate synthase